jgi:HEPN domain-containing protein
MSDRKHAARMLTLAKHDLSALRGMQDSASFTTAIFGFHAQQAVEKALKGWLTVVGGGYPKIHDLEELLALLAERGQVVPEEFANLIYLTAFAAQFRYDVFEELVPDLDRAAIVEEVARVVEHVERLIGAAGASS